MVWASMAHFLAIATKENKSLCPSALIKQKPKGEVHLAPLVSTTEWTVLPQLSLASVAS